MAILIDTSVIIAFERGQLAADAFDEQMRGDSAAISAITASELLHGVHRADTAQRRGRRTRLVEAIFEVVRVIPFDLEVARFHARIWADLRSRGQLIGAHDLQIAATAVAHGYRLATRNPREFERVEDLPVDVWG